MSLATRVVITLLLASTGLHLIFTTADPKEVRSGDQLCRELKEELLLSVEAGLLTRARAQTIHHRCLSDFGGRSL